MGRFSLHGDDTEWVSVSVERTTGCNLHAGILYRDANRRLFKLHLGWHFVFRNDARPNVACAIPNFDDGFEDKAEGEYIAGFCERVAHSKKNQRIPYNLKHDESIFFDENTGDIYLSTTSTGLSCATFVLAVLRSTAPQNRLIDVTGWPSASQDDISRQTYYVNVLLDSDRPFDQKQGRVINSEIGTPRIRPDHVAGACLVPYEQWPVRHAECETQGRIVRAALEEANLSD